jgi:hypothetical protein
MVCVNQTRPHCVNKMGKTQSETLAERHGRGTAWERYGMCESTLTLQISRQSAHEGGKVVSPYAPASFIPQNTLLVLIFVKRLSRPQGQMSRDTQQMTGVSRDSLRSAVP